MRNIFIPFFAWLAPTLLLLSPLSGQAQTRGAQKATSAIQENFGQEETPQAKPVNIYPQALKELKTMLEGNTAYSFKRAVFITENAYCDDKLSYSKFCAKIDLLTQLCRFYKANNRLLYDFEDREEIATCGAIFKVMTDTLKVPINAKDYVDHSPFRYDFNDIWGDNDWMQMFVSKLLITHTGNCHSLPLLYKILAEELQVNAYLAMAPNHIYIKQRCKGGGWYNTELTSATMPVDAWIMASGYINTDAIVNSIYMDSLSAEQSLAVCVTDLASGYQKRFGTGDGSFILQCCELALQYYPNSINALLLKAETLKRRLENLMATTGAKYPKEVMETEEGKKLFAQMQQAYVTIHQLGYRQMPRKMYQEWLVELNREKEKFANKKMIQNLKN